MTISAFKQASFDAMPSPDFHIYPGDVGAFVKEFAPSLPVNFLRPHLIQREAQFYLNHFAGTTMFAVKSNPHPLVIDALLDAGMTQFDVASLQEVRQVRSQSKEATLAFMHPVKAAEAIRESYFLHQVKIFSFDSARELEKIHGACDYASDLTLLVRLALPDHGSAAISLAQKFGADRMNAISLLKQARLIADRIGITFHVGSQCMDPADYERAIAYAASVTSECGVHVDIIDVGGGFPATYPDKQAAPTELFFKTISRNLSKYGLDQKTIWCEPGRALVAHAGSLLVRVEQCRGDLLYINDGTYGGLFDAGQQVGFTYPCKVWQRSGFEKTGPLKGYRLAGPTCDSIDMMNGPFMLPATIAEGDWIEIGQLGAYSYAMRTNFNGYGQSMTIQLTA